MSENSKDIEEALKVLEEIHKNPSMRRFYEYREKQLRDEAARISDAKKEGREEARKEGREEGRKEGRKEEINNLKSIVKDLLSIGLSVDDILKSPGINTRLSREDILEINQK